MQRRPPQGMTPTTRIRHDSNLLPRSQLETARSYQSTPRGDNSATQPSCVYQRRGLGAASHSPRLENGDGRNTPYDCLRRDGSCGRACERVQGRNTAFLRPISAIWVARPGDGALPSRKEMGNIKLSQPAARNLQYVFGARVLARGFNRVAGQPLWSHIPPKVSRKTLPNHVSYDRYW